MKGYNLPPLQQATALVLAFTSWFSTINDDILQLAHGMCMHVVYVCVCVCVSGQL